MLRVHISYTVDPNQLDAIKKSASIYMPNIPPSLRMEICARGVGFNTWAAMKAAPLTRRELNIAGVTEFASSRAIGFDPLALHLTLANATLLRVAALTPELHKHGMHAGYFSPTIEETRTVKASMAAGGTFGQLRKVLIAKFDESRKLLFESKQADQVLRAMALFSILAPTKTVGSRARSSYGIKHVSERLAYDLGDGLILQPSYVSNVDAIIAAIDQGFPTKPDGGKSPNVSIGITLASLRAAEDAKSSIRRFI